MSLCFRPGAFSGDFLLKYRTLLEIWEMMHIFVPLLKGHSLGGLKLIRKLSSIECNSAVVAQW